MAMKKGGKGPNMGKGSRKGNVNGKANATPGATYHAPKYGSGKSKAYKEGKGC